MAPPSSIAALAAAIVLSFASARAADEPPTAGRSATYAPAAPFLEKAAPVDPPQAFPATELAGLHGPATLDAVREGAPAVVVLWATWCGVCREEMPGIAALAARAEEVGARLVPVSVDHGDAAVARVRAWLDAEGYAALPALVDEGHALASAVGLTGTPTAYVLDRDGRLVARWVGRVVWDDAALEAYLAALSAASSPEAASGAFAALSASPRGD